MNKKYAGLMLAGLVTLSLSSPILFANDVPGAAPKTPAPEAVSATGQRSSLFGVILDIGLASFSQLREQWSYEGKQTVACPLHTTLEVVGLAAVSYGIYKLASAVWNNRNGAGGWFNFRVRGEGNHQ